MDSGTEPMKINYKEIGGPLRLWIERYLGDRQQRVVTPKHLDSILAPTVFIIYRSNQFFGARLDKLTSDSKL